MDKTSAIKLVQDTFQKPFNKEQFIPFIKNILNKLDESKAFPKVSGAYIKEIFREYVNSYERLGTYTDNEGKHIDVLIVYLQKESTIERARTAQRNFAARYLMDRDEKDAGLIAFVSPNSEDWRFSLVKMDYKFTETASGKVKVKEEFTPAKRFSYLVGENESSHTAQSKLVPFLENDTFNPTLKDLEEAFSIERVTEEFFEKYRALFLFVKEKLDDIVKKDKTIREDFSEKGVDTIDFSKKLMGQIVFLYFLQKKGWFGVEKNSAWGTGPKNFLRLLFEKKVISYKNFFNDVLEPLFYEALATEREQDFYRYFNCKIPFLNGGLFDPINNYDWVHTDILLDDEIFSNSVKTKEGDIGTGILDVFDRYNFTVKEDEPLEKEVAVDPEMLGKVFENLLEVKDRKSKGTYYTPREIVHYMCQESLINYLETELSSVIVSETKQSHLPIKEDIEILIRYGESAIEHDTRVEQKGIETRDYSYKIPEKIRTCAKLIDEKLANIRVCDPAAGSGAFLVGMMNEIVRARNTLTSYLPEKDSRAIYDFKRHAIHNCLYGVDIDPSAVEIAKLRLWLSLIVDEEDIKQIKPLPNLDYKIMQGNSLLEEYEGIKLFDEKLIIPETEKDKEIQLKNTDALISKIQKEYFDLHGSGKLSKQKKLEIETEIKKQKKLRETLLQNNAKPEEAGDFFNKPSQAKEQAEKLKSLHKKFFEETHKTEKENLRRQIDKLEWDLIEATLKEQNKESSIKKLLQFKKSNIRPFFLWKLHFAEIFQEKGGFDVVIANPPYGIVYDIDLKHSYELLYPTFKRNNDIYVAFYEKGFNFLNMKGILTYISPNTFLNGDYFVYLRRLLTEKSALKTIYDYKQIPIFVDPTVFVCVFICVKNNSINFPYSVIINSAVNSTTNFTSSFFVVNNCSDREFKPSNPIIEKLLISNNFIYLDELFLVKDVGFNYWTEGKGKKRDGDSIGDRIFYNGRRKNQKDVQFLKGRDIEKWGFQKPTNFLKHNYEDYLDKKVDTFRFSKNYFEYKPKIIYRQTSHTIIAAIDNNGHYLDKTVHLIVPRNGFDNYKPEFLLGLLNSSLFAYFYSYISQETEGRVFAQVKTTYIKKLLLPKNIKNNIIVEPVKKIINIASDTDFLENSKKQAKVKEYEAQIDQLVYKLYELTEEEIKIVESK